MTVQQFFNLNLVSENQCIALKILNDDEIKVDFRYQHKIEDIEEYLKDYADWNIAYFSTKIIQHLGFDQKSYLIIHLYRTTKGEN